MILNYLGTYITYKILLSSSTFILLMLDVWPVFKNLLGIEIL